MEEICRYFPGETEIPRKISVGVPVKIRTEYLSNTSLERYLQTDLFGYVVSFFRANYINIAHKVMYTLSLNTERSSILIVSLSVIVCERMCAAVTQ
jgi:hypothetical protein